MGGTGNTRLDRGLKLSLIDTLRQAWQDDDLRARIRFVLFVFAVYALGIQIPVPIRDTNPAALEELLQGSAFFQLLNTFGGGAFQRISIFALGLSPYITASIIMQVLTYANPAWKKELQEGGEYARRQQNRRTRGLTLVLCFFQGLGLLQLMRDVVPALTWGDKLIIVTFWTAGAMMLLWLGEQISERGIGNGVSLMIFAGIVISIPNIIQSAYAGVAAGGVSIAQIVAIMVVFLLTTFFIVYFTIAQRRIPIQHMRRNFGTKSVGGASSYLPVSVNMAGVIPIIFAVALIYMPAQFQGMFPADTFMHNFLGRVGTFTSPDFTRWEGWMGALFYSALIFFFTYFWNAMMYNVEDIANNLKKAGSYIPGIRPGKQTRDFLDGVISRVTFVGAGFLSIVALSQFVFPLIAPGLQAIQLIGGTSLLIMVSVALETMRQIESNILVKQYGG